jgi:hypothetical protein
MRAGILALPRIVGLAMRSPDWPCNAPYFTHHQNGQTLAGYGDFSPTDEQKQGYLRSECLAAGTRESPARRPYAADFQIHEEISASVAKAKSGAVDWTAPDRRDGDFSYSAGRTIPFPAATVAFFLDTLFAGFAGFPTLSRFGRSA